MNSLLDIEKRLLTVSKNAKIILSDIKFGHIATNLMMVATKQSIVDDFIEELNQSPIIKKVSIVNKFINIFIEEEILLQQNIKFCLVNREKINVEYVSPNPTGPLHLAHCRGSVIGDTLANFLSFLGYDVIKEMYINDFGSQMQKFYNSIDFYLGLNSEDPQYKGEYIKDIAKLIQEGTLTKKNILQYMINNIQNSLDKLHIRHDSIVYESEINKHVENIIKQLEEKHVVITKDNKKYLLSSKWGDEHDRVLEREDGSHTYIANDIAYHVNKLQRGCTKQVIVLGMDHAGYFTRLKAGLEHFHIDLKIVSCNVVKLRKENQLVKMSKRAGNFFTVDQLLEHVNHEVIRVEMLSKNYFHEFNFSLENVKNNKDLSFYIKYAYMRIESLKNHTPKNVKPDYKLLTNVYEQKLLQKICQWPYILTEVHETLNMHTLFTYTFELSQHVHSFLSNVMAIDQDKILSISRLHLLVKIQDILYIVAKILVISIKD